MKSDLLKAFERIKERVEVDGNGCWIWHGALSRDSYGNIRVGARAMSTHRVAYLAVNGEIPRGKVVRHRCDVRQCCNPEHLVVGDHEDNVQDIVDRKRHAKRRVLTTAERQEAVAMYRAGSTKRQIAEHLRCNWYTASEAIDAHFGRRGVVGRPKGSRNIRAKVSDDDRKEIARLYASGKFTQQQIAERYGLDQTYISLIVRALR